MNNAAIGAAVVTLLVIILISFLLSWPLMMLWNHCLVGAIDGVNPVGWLQMWGLSILIGLLFKNHTPSSKE